MVPTILFRFSLIQFSRTSFEFRVRFGWRWMCYVVYFGLKLRRALLGTYICLVVRSYVFVDRHDRHSFDKAIEAVVKKIL